MRVVFGPGEAMAIWRVDESLAEEEPETLLALQACVKRFAKRFERPNAPSSVRLASQNWGATVVVVERDGDKLDAVRSEFDRYAEEWAQRR